MRHCMKRPSLFCSQMVCFTLKRSPKLHIFRLGGEAVRRRPAPGPPSRDCTPVPVPGPSAPPDHLPLAPSPCTSRWKSLGPLRTFSSSLSLSRGPRRATLRLLVQMALGVRGVGPSLSGLVREACKSPQLTGWAATCGPACDRLGPGAREALDVTLGGCWCDWQHRSLVSVSGCHAPP